MDRSLIFAAVATAGPAQMDLKKNQQVCSFLLCTQCISLRSTQGLFPLSSNSRSRFTLLPRTMALLVAATTSPLGRHARKSFDLLLYSQVSKLLDRSPRDNSSRCDVCDKAFRNPKTLPRHRREQHETDCRKFYCPNPSCRYADEGKGFKREVNLRRHLVTCKSASPRGVSHSASPTAGIPKPRSTPTTVPCRPHRRRDNLLERAATFSGFEGSLPTARLATLLEIIELQKWKSDAGARITELHALREATQGPVSGGLEQVLVASFEELIDLQDLDSKFSRRIEELRASQLR